MNKTPQERADELYPNNRTFCGGVANIAREAYVKGCQETAERLTDIGRTIQLPVPANAKIDKKAAREQILGLLDTCDNVIAFSFMRDGKAALVTCTEDEIYDKLAVAIMRFLQRLAKEVEEDLEGEQ